MISLILTACTALAPANSLAGQPLSDALPAHLGIALKLPDQAALTDLIAQQSDPESPLYHQWLTPAQFGERFGLGDARYAELGQWIAAAGFRVTSFPNRLFFEATGTVGAVRRLLNVQPVWAVQPDGRLFRTYTGTPEIPERFGADVLHIAGLDTRVRFHHYIQTGAGQPAFGADDLRAFYNMASLVTSNGAADVQTVVIGTQEQSGPPAASDVSYYYQNVSSASAKYNPISLPNPNGDYDQQGANQEYELDVEMQSVGAPKATNINLVLSPASEVFATGVNYAASTLSSAA